MKKTRCTVFAENFVLFMAVKKILRIS